MLIVLSSLYFIFSLIWFVYTYCVWKNSNYNIQRWLFVLPLYKLLLLLQVTLEYYTCPWDSENSLVYLSIFAEQILQILVEICSSTVVNCIFYLICLGWCSTISHVERNTISNVMIVGGSLYLLQLAKSYSSEDKSLFPIMFNFILGVEYLVLFYINLKSIR
jgi:hypothetical protein